MFAVSYALAKLWMSLGVTPAASLGHSIGEFVSACLAEVFSLEDALRAVAARGRLMQSMPGGAMLAVMTPAETARARCCRRRSRLPRSIRRRPALYLARARTLKRSTRSSARRALPQRRSIPRTRFPLGHDGRGCGAVRRSHAQNPLSPPQLPYISNVTGAWITDEQATDPAYWGQHMRAPVQFHKGLSVIHDQMPGYFP